MSYRTLPRYANSDLGEFRNLLFGYPIKPQSGAQTFGTLFHALLLENKPDAALTPARLKQAQTMRDAVLKNLTSRQLLELASKEVVKIWDDDRTGLLCKARLDLWEPDQALIVDVKTTSCRTYGDFLNQCEQYDYDRQAAFYVDGSQARRYVILGVQKQAPFSVFYFEATACRGCIEGGRKKYQALLKSIKEVGFQPTSWASSIPSLV
ncbi:PD-(D/E)XK nuclease-like domain-containing protein [Spirosoma luteum]|uniref:PD-(D/E)XK nuclease-like domain-containing protein n=1 Tax=Spirosoma luteum TaxID=431553 RepID=UPI0003628CD1|nr:PD-(D/E)XK nuclease-like domain-containing protein [Spirosoma luteum]